MKSYSEFLNENLFGQFNYYGSGSLFPLIQKLKNEGKSIDVIVTYLRSLGIDEGRQREVLTKLFPVVVCNDAITKEDVKETVVQDEDKIKDKLSVLESVLDDPKKLEKIKSILSDSTLN